MRQYLNAWGRLLTRAVPKEMLRNRDREGAAGSAP
jgi:hypothetical protein